MEHSDALTTKPGSHNMHTLQISLIILILFFTIVRYFMFIVLTYLIITLYTV
jgi:hypothetical protein